MYVDMLLNIFKEYKGVPNGARTVEPYSGPVSRMIRINLLIDGTIEVVGQLWSNPFCTGKKTLWVIYLSYYRYSQFKIQVVARVLSVNVVVLRFRFHGWCRLMPLSKPCFGRFMEKILTPAKD